MNFNEKLQYLRKERGLSQENLAEALHISRQAITKWENGQSYPDLENLITLSNLLGVTIDKLVKSDTSGCENFTKARSLLDEKLLCFLHTSNLKGYAGNGILSTPSRPASKDFQYEEGNLKYIDTYVGGERFSGEEGIWVDNMPYWTMNYCGRLLDRQYNYDFLMEALRHVPKEQPYRGPVLYQKGNYLYHCHINGDFSWLQGYEEIFYERTKIYECYFHGGIIMP